jgi:hypothetical protein
MNMKQIAMENKALFQKLLPHLVILFLFLFITFVYFSPLFEGKTLVQHDMVQSKAAAKEVLDYHEKTGKWTLWTNSMFGGMPAYLIATDFPNSWSTRLGRFFNTILPEPANLVVLSLVGFYILLCVLRFNPWLAATGAIAFTFGSYNIINIEAGHLSKVIAIAYLPPIIAGVILTYQGRYWLGGAITALFLALQLYGNHIQITFYMFISLALYGLFELIYAIREKELKRFSIATLVLAVAVGLSFGSHASRLLTTYEYSKESIRGRSELTQKQNTDAAGGLDKEYAFRWSYGKAESFTLLIPNFFGGATYGNLNTSSDTYKTLLTNGVPQGQARQFVDQQVPVYWGDQPLTGGPAYAGAIICFLFVLGMFVVKSRIKWWLLAVSILFIMLSWGKNLAWFNYFIFDYVPMFNKFRAVTMILSVVQVYLCLLALLAVREIVQRDIVWAELKKPLAYSLGITAGLALLIGIFAGGIFDFSGQGDAQLPVWLQEALRDDRKSLLQKDAFRSVFFILAAAALLWAFVQDKVKAGVLYGGLLVLVLIDMFSVGKRYLNNADFVTKRKAQESVQPTEATMQIMADKTLHYRVLDLTKGLGGIFSDATPSIFHHTINGYHGAKMKRFQELADSVLYPQLQQFATKLQSENFNPEILSDLSALNMLNTKYLVLAPAANGIILNPYALGNAWFVDEYKLVPNADEEIKAIADFDPARTAIIDQRYQTLLNGLKINPDSAASIQLTSYAPDQLVYKSNTSSSQLAVFSEMYYKGQDDWQAYIDDKPQPHLRVNYTLRAMVVPAGSHTIKFRFEPKIYRQGETVSLICSVLLFGGVMAAFYMDNKKKQLIPLSHKMKV